MGHSEGRPESKVHSNTDLPKKDRNISNKQPNPVSTRTAGTTTNKAQSQQKEENNIRAELNYIETKRRTQRINKSRSWFFDKIKYIYKPLTHQGNKRTPQNKIRSGRGEIITDITEIQRIVRNQYKQLYARNLKIKVKWENFQ